MIYPTSAKGTIFPRPALVAHASYLPVHLT